MPAHHRRLKQASKNPYSDRGLEKFALVSAELEAKKEILIAQLGTPLCLIRFSIGSDQSSWIPIIIASPSPTSKAEIRALRRAASVLISTEGKPDGEHQNIFQTSQDIRNNEDKTHSGDLSNKDSSTEAAGSTHTGTLGYLIVATQGFLWMAKLVVFSLQIVSDIVSDLILSRWHGGEVTVSSTEGQNLSKEEGVTIYHTYASSKHLSSLPSLRNGKQSTKGIILLHELHVDAPNIHDGLAVRKFPSVPVTSEKSRVVTKPLISASVSLRKMPHSHGQALHMDIIKENRQVQKANPNKVRLGGSTSGMGAENERKERSKRLGQALTSAGLVLGLGGLVFGYIWAIVSMVCWWYALPILRKAVGDKPFVRKHHYHNIHGDTNKAYVQYTRDAQAYV